MSPGSLLDAMFQAGQPNGLAFSCRERAADHLPKSSDLAREAVSCNAGLGGTGSHTAALWACITGKHLPYDCCNLLSKQLLALGREVQAILA